MSDMQHMILRSFFTNEAFMRKVVPFMDPAYFEGTHKPIFKEFVRYVAEYSNIPSMMIRSRNFSDVVRNSTALLTRCLSRTRYSIGHWEEANFVVCPSNQC